MIVPIINESQLEGLLGRTEEGRRSRATLLLEGKPKGLDSPPHVFAKVLNDMPIARNDPFAPFIRARDKTEALRIANGTEHGVSGVVFTRDIARGRRFAQRLRIGMVHVNGLPVVDLPNSRFGGEKNSGLGRFNGRWAIEAFTMDKWITVQHEPHALAFDARRVSGAWVA